MVTKINIAPENSLLLVMDRDGGGIPELMNGKLVVSTPSCIAVGTLSGADGETWVTLTDEEDCVHESAGLHKVFSGPLTTPNREVRVCTVLLQPVLRLPVPRTQSNVEIWANDDTEPDRLCVLVHS